MSDVRARTLEPQRNMESARQPRQELALQYEQGQVQTVTAQAAYPRAQINGNRLTAANLLVMQRTVGNRQMQRMLAAHTGGINGQPPSALMKHTWARAFTHQRVQQSGVGGIRGALINEKRSLSPVSQHVIQADSRDAGVSEAGPSDAGVPLPGGVPPTAEELLETRLRQSAAGKLQDEDIGPALELARRDNNQLRYDELIAQLRDRETDHSFGVGLPAALPRGAAGNAMVTPEVSLAILENVIAGRPPFRPELGVGGASWFVTEGTPYTGVGSGNTISVQAELIDTQNAVHFEQAQLDVLYAEETARARPEVEAQIRERFRVRTGRDAPAQLSNALAEKVARQLRGLAERRMWERVAAQVRTSRSQVGVVNLPAGGRFSAAAGRFTVVADAAKIRLRGGPLPLLDAIRSSGQASPLPALEQSAGELARAMGLAGRVRQVFRIGGKILIVVAIAADAYEIITAEDHLEATIVSLSGWAGASAGAAAFSALWTPADAAGPWAWVAHGVGALVSGAVGYWVGSSATRYVYRLVVSQRGQVRSQ